MKALDVKKHLGETLDIPKRLNIAKILKGENNSHYYDQMKDWFLDDLTMMVQSPQGMTRDNGKIRFSFNGHDTIWFFILDFDDCYGNYLGIGLATTKRRPKGSPIISGAKEYKELRTKEINDIIQNFADTAENLGYLI